MSEISKVYQLFLVLLLGLIGSACGSASVAQSAIDSAKIALNSEDCDAAYSKIYPVYNSSNTNNDVRFLMASTYGCYAGVNMLGVLSDITTFSGNLGGSGFWAFLVHEFPSTASPRDDKKPTAAAYGIDAIMSVLNTSGFLLKNYEINSTSYNPGSILYSDRTDEANAYLTFLALAQMGTLMNRYGAPSNNVKTVDLPWISAKSMTSDGCAFASGLLNYYDGLASIQSASSGSVAEVYGVIQTFLSSGLDAACSTGCALCGLSCSTCPSSLRSRNSCTGSTQDENSCAAAGLVLFVNLSWI